MSILLSLSYRSLSHIQTTFTLYNFSLYSRKFRIYPYLETLLHTYASLRNYITISNGRQLNVLECSRILHCEQGILMLLAIMFYGKFLNVLNVSEMF